MFCPGTGPRRPLLPREGHHQQELHGRVVSTGAGDPQPAGRGVHAAGRAGNQPGTTDLRPHALHRTGRGLPRVCARGRHHHQAAAEEAVISLGIHRGRYKHFLLSIFSFFIA